MLKAQKRLKKREIKEDKFVTLYFQAQEYLKQNGSHILSVLGVIVAVIVVALVLSQKSLKKETEAAVELAKAQLKYSAGDYAGAIPLLRDLCEEFDGTDSGVEGLIYLANAIYREGNYDEAMTFYEKYLSKGDDEVLLSSALAGKAACLEAQGKPLEAAQQYQAAAEQYSDVFLSAEQLYSAARCYALAGHNKEAKTSLQELLEGHGESSVKADAELLLAELP